MAPRTRQVCAALPVRSACTYLDRHIDEHTKRALNCIKYHGPNRERALNKLREADIVITTYHTLASDASSAEQSLNKIEWYRLVLDEGMLFQACCRMFCCYIVLTEISSHHTSTEHWSASDSC